MIHIYTGSHYIYRNIHTDNLRLLMSAWEAWLVTCSIYPANQLNLEV